MSLDAITWAYKQTDIPGVARAVLVNLCNRADESRYCFPQIATITRDTGFKDRAVRDALNLLVQQGCITRKRQANPDGSMGQYEYWVMTDRTPKTEPKTASEPAAKPKQKHGPARNAAGEKTQRIHRPAADAAGSSSDEKTVQDHGAALNAAGPPPAPDAAGTTGARRRSIEEPPLRTNQQKKETPVVVEPASLQSVFLEIWNLWPGAGRIRSKSKAQCLETLRRALVNRQPAMMVEAVRRAVKTFDNPKYVPALDRWLKDGKFEHFFPNAEIHELPFSNSATDDDWRAAVRRWADDGYWPSTRLGPAPNQVGYRGPIKPLEDLLPSLGDHPAAREIRSTINLRASA